jgi:hypothetical protein
MTKTEADRLLTLAYFLKTQVENDEYNQNYFGLSSCEDLEDKISYVQADEICGTSACAAGWATVVFPKTFRLQFLGEMDQKRKGKRATLGYIEMRYPHWFDRQHKAWQKATITRIGNWFGLDDDEAYKVFGPDDCNRVTPKQKAKQIEEIVAQHGYVYAN